MIPNPCLPEIAKVDWCVSPQPVPYLDAVAAMERRIAAIADGQANEQVWLLEHPPIYTAGTSAHDADLVDPNRFPVFATGRGGQYTYHGPGQRVAYVMLNLKARGGDVRAFVGDLAGWIIATFAEFGITGVQRPGRVGVWVERRTSDGAIHDDKIAAIGIRVRRGVTYHGVSLNISTDLTHFEGIVPCGLANHGVTSLSALGVPNSMAAVDAALERQFQLRF